MDNIDTSSSSLAPVIGWMIISGLLTWNLVTTNQLQIEVTKISSSINYSANEMISIMKENEVCEVRIDGLESRVTRLETNHEPTRAAKVKVE